MEVEEMLLSTAAVQASIGGAVRRMESNLARGYSSAMELL